MAEGLVPLRLDGLAGGLLCFEQMPVGGGGWI
jgi:hypothetical protein